MKKTKGLSLILVFLMIISIISTPFTSLAAENTEKTIKIFHINDSHGRAVENEKDAEIGFPKLKTLMDENKNAVLIDAGDTFHGTTFATISRGESIVNLMNEVGFALSVPGNHDFNYGYERLIQLSKIAKFPLLTANVVKKDGTSDFTASMIKEVEGVKIGFFGLSTPETKTKSNPINTEGVDFPDYIEAAKKEVAKLKSEGAQAIVAVVHLGLDKSSIERSDILAEKVEGIDLIIDGHSHTLLKEGQIVNGVLIAQTNGHLKNVGEVNLTFKDGKLLDKKAKVLSYEDLKDVKPDEKILTEIAKVEESNKPYLERVIGKTTVDLVGERSKVRTGETNFGNLLTDAMIDATGADVAITNGGGIRASIPAGDITMGQILTSFPFTNYPVKLEVKGDVILKALEHGVDSAPEEAGKFPHVSGLSFKYDPNRPKGDRVFELKVKDQDIDLNKVYTLVTNDFMAVGGDGYEMFKDAKKLGEYPLLSEVIAKYIEAKKTVEPRVMARIVVGEKPGESTPGFTDIKNNWAEKYITYVVDKGYFKGVSETKFSPESNITRGMLVTVLGRYDGVKEDSEGQSKFSDVNKDAYYAPFVKWAEENKIVEGYEDNTFKPEKEVSRAEMATIISRYLVKYKNIKIEDKEFETFSDDAKLPEWAKSSIYDVTKLGIITGFANDNNQPGHFFDPTGTTTRAQLAAVMYRIDQLKK